MTNICLSGGAEGADTWWTKEAKKNGHEVINFTFRNHGSRCSNLQVLNEKELAKADEALIRANLSMKRKFPTKDAKTNNLLRRNYYQIVDSEALYAITTITKGQVDGGTGWAVNMFIDRMIIDKVPDLKCYVFDQKERQWYQYVNGWVKIDKPEIPSGRYTGIGARDILESGVKAIQKVYQ